MRQPDLFKLPQKPWNAGRIIGPKAPLKPKHIWSIRQQLKTSRRIRDLALFNCALDAKLRMSVMMRPRPSLSDRAPVREVQIGCNHPKVERHFRRTRGCG